MGSSSRPLAACCTLLLICAASVYYSGDIPAPINPCSSSLGRALLAVTSIDPYILSCGSSSSLSSSSSIGGPLATNLHTCVKATLPENALPPFYCCPPVPNSATVNFTLPDPAEPLRVRRPVHAVGAEYMAKYERLIAIMKALPESHPHSFYQMANIHCAYCTGSYRQTGDPELFMQIHFSWFFFPFHRAYIYFFERIAAKLLGDPGFAVPFWSWDVPEGMRMPPEFDIPSSPLYDPIRNPNHSPPKLVDLLFAKPGIENNLTDDQQIQTNLQTMYKQMIGNAALPTLFHGQPFRAGQTDMPGAGTVEQSPHNTMHTWVGNATKTSFENMGTYYSAGRDPLFYVHHNNLDRLWDAWRGFPGHADFTDPDWLDSSFLFYDEEARLVRITVRDVLDIDKLRYKFEGVGMPWADAKPPVTPGVNTKKGSVKSVRFPVSLDTAAVTAQVMRPPIHRSLGEEEVLVVEGIQSDGTQPVKFDVYINAMEYEKVEPGGRELAGTYVTLSHLRMDGSGKGKPIETSMRVALSQLLKDLDAQEDQSVTVTLVPRSGKVKIRSLRIAYITE
ncbi:unnamed protein product [Alopecurus aequalis]